jgi:hypothetical protein
MDEFIRRRKLKENRQFVDKNGKADDKYVDAPPLDVGKVKIFKDEDDSDSDEEFFEPLANEKQTLDYLESRDPPFDFSRRSKSGKINMRNLLDWIEIRVNECHGAQVERDEAAAFKEK